MLILGGNRKLLWTMLAGLAWACLALGAALGPPGGPPDNKPGPFRFSVGPPPDGISVEGDLVRLDEQRGQLIATIANAKVKKLRVTGPNQQTLDHQPPGLQLQLAPAGTAVPATPELHLDNGMLEPRRLPSRTHGILTQRYFVKYGNGHVHFIPRPGWLKPPRDGREPRDGMGRERMRERIKDAWQQRGRNRRGEQDERQQPPPDKAPGGAGNAPPPPPGDQREDGPHQGGQ